MVAVRLKPCLAAAGSGSFLLKVTIGFVVVFFVTSISLNYLASHAAKQAQQMAMPAPVKQDTASPNNIPMPSSSDQTTEKKSR